MHYFEGPFDEVNSRGSYPTLLDDFILNCWIKTHWMDMTYGLCNYTIQQQLQQQESLTRLTELQKKFVLGRRGIPTRDKVFFFFFLKREMMMQINPHQEILIKKLKPWIEYSSIWMLKIGPTEPGHPSKQTKDQLGPKQFPNIQEISLSGIVLIRQLTTRGSANCRNRQQANQFVGLI